MSAEQMAAEDPRMVEMRREIEAFDKKHHATLFAALALCRTEYTREKCIAAYSAIGQRKRDVIGQKHGLEAMEWRTL